MIETWPAIVAQLGELRRGTRPPHQAEARGAIERLAEHIARTPLAAGLSPWLSMGDLCLQQSGDPYSGPHLRVGPLPNGKVEFRYVDTAIPARQWSRQVPPDAVIGRWEAFLDQLRWVPSTSPAPGPLNADDQP